MKKNNQLIMASFAFLFLIGCSDLSKYSVPDLLPYYKKDIALTKLRQVIVETIKLSVVITYFRFLLAKSRAPQELDWIFLRKNILI